MRARSDLLATKWTEKFPPYGCNKALDESRFRLSPGYSVTGNKVCFTGSVVPCGSPGAACCKVDFYKLELSVGE